MKKLSMLLAEKVYEDYLRGNGYHKKTIYSYLSCLKKFRKFLDKINCSEDLRDIKEEDLRKYIKYLRTAKSEKRCELLSEVTIDGYFYTVKQLFRSLYVADLLIINPAAEIELKRNVAEKRRVIFTQEEMASLLDGIELDTAKGERDRALFELMYSSGLRISEVIKSEISDLDFEKRMMLIRESKFSKDRIVPVSEVAMKFLEIYLSKRKNKKKKDLLFPGRNGYLSNASINKYFRKYAKRIGIEREFLGVHTIRHSIATHLLENGANIRYVQELLGHESIETTVQYTKGVVDSLKRIYKSYHPRENEYCADVSDEYLERLKEFKKNILFWSSRWEKQKKSKRAGKGNI